MTRSRRLREQRERRNDRLVALTLVVAWLLILVAGFFATLIVLVMLRSA